jgi:ribosomal protein S18 acetylase RimI-like enzyme
MTEQVQLARMTIADAGEVLTLQRAAYVTEAQVYKDAFIPALTQSLKELVEEIESGGGFLLRLETGRMVGAVRVRIVGGLLHIGRLAVAPDLQRRGFGSMLLNAAEAEAASSDEHSGLAPDATVLFTGKLSEANLRLYRRRGYVETHREVLRPGVELVHLRKEFVGSH